MLQLVTTMPTAKLPKKFVMGTATEQEIEMMEREADTIDNMEVDDMGRRGQILWIRGLTRLQHQVGSLISSPHPSPPLCLPLPLFTGLP